MPKPYVVGRELLQHKAGYVWALLVLLTGCATVDQRAGFSDITAAVEARSGKRVVWHLGIELGIRVAQEVRALLQDTLTADGAIQVALLNNRDLQAVYAALGVAHADLAQAGLLKNPVFDGAIRFPVRGGPLEPDLSTAVSFLDVFYAPLRKRVAAARFEDTKLRVTGVVLDFAATVQTAFYRHQAHEQMLELEQTIVQALAAALEVAQRLHAAGNITDLELMRERALAAEAKLQLSSAETAVHQSREHLNTLMGLWGQQTTWHIDRRLPDIPEQSPPVDELEMRALRQSIDVANARQRLLAAGEQVGVSRATALVPELSLGSGGDREEGAWEVEPVFIFPLPLFDQGQARIGRAMAELHRAQQEYYALGVRVRTTARALYYRDIVLPLRERIVNETQLQYNAMQLSVFELLRAREQQMHAAVAYIDTLRDYWLARTDLAQILSGRLPAPNSFATDRIEQPQKSLATRCGYGTWNCEAWGQAVDSEDMSERGTMLSSYGTTCLIRLAVRAVSSDVMLQAQLVIWRDIVPIYAEDLP